MIMNSIAMYTLSNEETRLSGVDLHNWSRMKEAGWYCYGTIIGESITRDTKSEKAFALRSVATALLSIYSSFKKQEIAWFSELHTDTA